MCWLLCLPRSLTENKYYTAAYKLKYNNFAMALTQIAYPGRNIIGLHDIAKLRNWPVHAS